jgi:hypothetical protein
MEKDPGIVSHQPEVRPAAEPTAEISYDPSRIAALRHVIARGREIATDHPEVAGFYRTTDLNNLEIAGQVVPDLAEAYPGVASKAVGYAVRSLIPDEEREAITAARRARILREQQGEEGSERWVTRQRRAAERRHELHGVDIAAMIKGQGRTPWTEMEVELVKSLAENPDFQHKEGKNKGRPRYADIAYAINEEFHNGEEVRYRTSVSMLIRDLRRQKKRSIEPKTIRIHARGHYREIYK